MATSNSFNFSVNRDVLIKDALIDIGAIAQEDTPSSPIIEHAARQLNLMLKAWQSKGLRMWKSRNATLLLQKDTQSYSIGFTGDHFFLDSELVETEMRVAAIATDTIMEVDSTTGMAASDNIGVELDDGSMHFTTISSVTDSNTLVLASAIPAGDAVAIDNNIYTYTTKAQRPLQIIEARIRDDTNFDRPVKIISREEYLQYSDKATSGSIVSIYYDPQLTNGTLYVYAPESETVNTLKMVVQYPFEDMDATANDFDFPQEWLMAVKCNLSLVLAPSYGVQGTQLKTIAALADGYLDEAMGFDKENNTSILLQPEQNWSDV